MPFNNEKSQQINEVRSWRQSIFNCKFLIWWSAAWGIAVMAAAPIANYLTPFLDPSYANQWTPDIYWRLVLYWHGGIFIPWITVLAAVCCVVFNLDKMGGLSGRLIRESIFVGGIFAVPVAGIAGIFDIYDNFAWGIPLWTQIAAFVIGDEMAIALIIAMIIKPRATGHSYLKMGLPYYTALLGVVSALISAMMGHIGGWISWFGPNPSLVSQYISGQMTPALGFYNQTSVITFTENVVTSHSHLMLPALMAGVIAIVAAFYGYYGKWTKSERGIAGFGFLVMLAGLVLSNWVYIVSGVGNYATPTLFQTPDGVNGIAMDDVLTGIVGIGGAFVLIALLLSARRDINSDGKKRLVDPLFLSIVASWISIYLVIPITGYYIEMNHWFYGNAGLAFDQAFGRFHQDFGFFLLPALVTFAVALGLFDISGKAKNRVGYLFLSGVAITFIFGELYTMAWQTTDVLAIAVFGGILIGLGVLSGILYLRVTPKVVSRPTLELEQVTKEKVAV